MCERDTDSDQFARIIVCLMFLTSQFLPPLLNATWLSRIQSNLHLDGGGIQNSALSEDNFYFYGSIHQFNIFIIPVIATKYLKRSVILKFRPN